MRINSITLLSLCAWSCLAQLPVVPLQRFVATVPGPPTIGGLEYWWIAEDVTNLAVIQTWTDRIQANVFKTNIHSSAVTPANGGILFAGAQCLTNGALGHPVPNTAAPFVTVCIIFAPTTGHTGVQQGLWTRGNSGSTPINLNTSAAGSLVAGNVAWSDGSGLMADKLSASIATHDFLFTQTNLSASAHIVTYTNGLFATSIGPVNTDGLLMMGGGSDNGSINTLPGWFTLYEVMVFTNTTRGFNNTEIATIHTYATNKYGFSP